MTRHRAENHVSSETVIDQRKILVYQVTAGQNVLGAPATLLELDHRVMPGAIGSRFARKRDLLSSE